MYQYYTNVCYFYRLFHDLLQILKATGTLAGVKYVAIVELEEGKVSFFLFSRGFSYLSIYVSITLILP